jgi:glycosyltransferase involved in cell wall biosynthesis
MAADSSAPTASRIAVLIPCLNEEQTVAKVVADFGEALEGSEIYVYDNGSVDGTADIARASGAIVRTELRRGKGNVVRRMLSDVEADVYILVDGDGTYSAEDAQALVDKVLVEGCDLVNGARTETDGDPFPTGHRLGNRVLSGLVRYTFRSKFNDMLSGYKALSRRFAKSFPAMSGGFDIETEMTIHALELRMPVAEVPVSYRERPSGSSSKLSTVRDGLIILRTIFLLIKEEKPLQFFTLLFLLLAAVSVGLGIPIIQEFIRTGLVPRFPTAILASALMILAFISLVCGVILDSVSRGQRAQKRLHYLSIPGPLGDRTQQTKN